VAGRAIPLTVLICCISYIHMLILYEIEISPATQKPVCPYTGPVGPYRIFFSYFNLIFYGLAPPICMLVFGLLTVRNINNSKRVAPRLSTGLQNGKSSNGRPADKQVLRMLLVQVSVYSIIALIYSVTNIIIVAVTTPADNISQVARTNLILSIVGIISSAGPSLSFYFFTLSSGLFRKELKKLFNVFIRTGNPPQVNTAHMVKTDPAIRTAITQP
jgi:hypothetical protein